MTKKNVWRLAKLPTPDELAGLVREKILTKDEAHEILLSQEDDSERSTEDLKSEIFFLRELVQKLSNNSRTEIYKYMQQVQPPYIQFGWYKPYQYWCNTGTLGSTSGGLANAVYAPGGANTLTLSSATTTQSAASVLTGSTGTNFTGIKTF